MLSALSHPQVLFTPQRPSPGVVAKILALIEVTAIIAASTLAAVQAQKLISPGLGETLGLISGTAPDYIASSLAMLKQFAVQYGVALILILVLAATRKRNTAKAYALTSRPVGLAGLIALGIIAGFIVSIPAQTIFLAKEIWPLGKDTILWSVMESNPWDTTFWIFAATASFFVVPIIEELLWRSYALGRLVEAFKPGAALLLSSLVFASLHVQYLVNGDLLGYATMASVIISAIIFGLLTLTTGSVIPAVIAHMILNTPMNMEFGAARLAIGLLALTVFAKAISRYLSLLRKMIIAWDTIVMLLLCLALGGSVYALITQGVNAMAILGVAMALSFVTAFIFKSPWRYCEDEAA
ncbi:MAG: CPBP family intramembrane glutamic endopeptidase [Pseudomonadota bacterium]